MALIKSNILAQVSGSINGITFSHGQGGAYIRNRSIPSNPETDRQDQVRTAMTSISTAWGTSLDDTQRDAWRTYGSTLSITNRLGDTIKLSGIAAFQRVNLFRMSTLNQTMLLDPPAQGGVDPEPPPTFVSVGSGSPDPGDPPILLVNLNTITNSYSLAVYYSGYIPPGVRYFRGPYQARELVAVSAATAAVTLNALPEPDPSINAAAKITLYRTATGEKIWTVHTDPVRLTV